MKRCNRIVIKVGTSTLTYDNGNINLTRIEKLTRVLSDLMNSGKEVVLVSSGAVGVGVNKIKLKEKTKSIKEKQSAAAVGQCELMFMYDKMFAEFGHTVGQFLITKRDVDNDECRENLINAFEKTFEYGAIPIINENDAVAVEEIVFGDNDSLSAIVAKLIKADALLILTDIDGLYDKDPHKDEDARIIPVVEEITEHLFEIAGGKGSKFGTGGMITKLQAAQIATEVGIPTIVMNGGDSDNIYRVLEGHQVGTFFTAK